MRASVDYEHFQSGCKLCSPHTSLELADSRRRIRDAENSATQSVLPKGKDCLPRMEAGTAQDKQVTERKIRVGTGDRVLYACLSRNEEAPALGREKVLYTGLLRGKIENKINYYNQNVYQQNLASLGKADVESGREDPASSGTADIKASLKSKGHTLNTKINTIKQNLAYLGTA